MAQQPGFTLVGLPDAAVREAYARVRSALANCGFYLPTRHITVNLSPADVRKEGSRFDLPIAIGILHALELLSEERRAGPRVRRRALARRHADADPRHALDLGRAGGRRRDPRADRPRRERERGRGRAAACASSARRICSRCCGTCAASSRSQPAVSTVDGGARRARRRLRRSARTGAGQARARSRGRGRPQRDDDRPAGIGKDDARATPARRSSRGSRSTRRSSRRRSTPSPACFPRAAACSRAARSARRTTRSPRPGMAGGGTPLRPGEVSLAHHGVLFLDELPEFRRETLEVMRQPMEDGSVTIARAARTVTFPARFTLAAALEPLPLRLSSTTPGASASARSIRSRATSRRSPARCSTASTCRSKWPR